MVGSPGNGKRKFTTDKPISPPPLRRKVQSGTTQSAVSSFFTPASQKPPEKIAWQERGVDDDSPSTLLVGKYVPAKGPSTDGSEKKRRKVAAFDFDSTLVTTASGKKFASDANDWKWWHPSVPGKLRKLYHEDGFQLVVLSNQGGISMKPDPKVPKSHQNRLAAFKTKAAAILTQLDIPVSLYAATAKDVFRKPRTGMWNELLQDYDVHVPGDLDLERSLFVGDAGGRTAGGGKPKDFSCSDRNFAENVGLAFHTPEEFFLGEAPRPFTRDLNPSEFMPGAASEGPPPAYTKKNAQDIVLLCGSPGAGKSTFYWKQLEPLGYTRINQDTLKTRDKCIKVAGQSLEEGRSVAVDNTNADVEVRSKWVELATKCSIPIRCVLFTAPAAICEHNDAVRALNHEMNPEKRTILPTLAFRGFSSRYQRPALSEGFEDVTEVAFTFTGSEAERAIWARYWT